MHSVYALFLFRCSFLLLYSPSPYSIVLLLAVFLSLLTLSLIFLLCCTFLTLDIYIPVLLHNVSDKCLFQLGSFVPQSR